MSLRRFSSNPIIHPGLSESIGRNINGPSLIAAPEWLPHRLGRYYLYFAHHRDAFIRLAYADELDGPWKIHEPGVLHVRDTPMVDHVASPDVHVDHAERRIRMYFHGVIAPADQPAPQRIIHEGFTLTANQITRVALSEDGLRFESLPEILAPSYVRAFEWAGYTYLLAMPCSFFRSRDPLRGFEPGPALMDSRVRHSAVRRDGSTLHVWFSRREDKPERILHTSINLRGDWMNWQASAVEEALRPELAYEGADCPLVASETGAIHERVHQVRDPACFEEGGRRYLLYSVAGESGIAIAELT